MESSFVKEISLNLIKNHGKQGLKNVLILIPSQRIGLHLKKELAIQFEEPAWLPEISTIDSFVTSLSDLSIVDELDAIFELYLSYLKIFEKPDDFDTFLTWGKQILSDFNDIDKYLLESKDVFKNLRSIKEIESWSFNAEELTETQQKFLEFWDRLGQLYIQYNEDLRVKGLCTKSSVYKKIASNQIEYLAGLKYEKIYIVGFNALSTSETAIFKFIVDSGQGIILWDADAYYINDKNQEAGSFIRKYLKLGLSSKQSYNEGIKGNEKVIHIHGANSNIGQTMVASHILEKESFFQTKKSAIVFADESLLRPMLNVLPSNISKMNVAMGYPLNASNSYSLLDQLFVTLKNVGRYQQKSSLYYKDFEQIFHHELIQLLVGENEIQLEDIEVKINKENYTYIPKKNLELALGDNFGVFDFLFFKKEDGVVQLLQGVINLFHEVRDVILKLNADVIEKEAVLLILTSLKKVQHVLEKNDIVKSPESLLLLIKQLIRTGKISFYGEPLQGLQVLGLLETRGLDFENLVLLSCNEEVLPAASFTQSLMPYDLRKYFGLPTKDDKEAMFAYYFYRLLQKAKNIHLIYNNGAPDGMSSNEISRYLLQIQNELPSESVKIEIHSGHVLSDSIELDAFVKVPGSPILLERIEQFLNQGLSASAINKFIECPRNFFFNYLLRPNESERVEENIESSTYGTIVHEVLEKLFRIEGGLITNEVLDSMLDTFESVLDAQFKTVFPSENFKSGKNLLQYETAKYSIQQFLKSEKQFVKENGMIKILGLEKNFRKEVVCQTPSGEVTVLLKGNIDRIDQVGNTIRIIDYKTGKVSGDLVLNNKLEKMYSQAMQLLVYQYLYDGSEGGKEVVSGILSLKDIKAGLQVLKENKKDIEGIQGISKDLKENFEEFIADFVSDLQNSNYAHNTSSQYCSLC